MDDKAVKKILLHIYERLISRYGPQKWWPAEGTFEVIVGAILTQSAAWTNVEKAIRNLKASGKMSPGAIHQLPQEELAQIIRPSGYYNVKAKKLQAFVRWLEAQYSYDLKELFNIETSQLRKQLLGIFGIGEETADSIILYAANKPVFVIDAYTRRIIRHAGLAPRENSYAAYQTLFMGNLPADTELFNEYHALLVRLGKDVCKTRPMCDQCCLNITETTVAELAHIEFPCSIINQPCS